jgi:hypothetical protein
LERIEKADNADRKSAAIDEYLKHYGSKNTENLETVRALDRDMKVAAREKVLLKRYSMTNLRARAEDGDDKEAYEKTMAALTAEEVGDLPLAKTTWSDLAEKFGKDSDTTRALWGWHARKKLNDILNVEALPKTILSRIDDKFRLEDKDIVLDNEDEAKASAALRLELFGDLTLARERWQQLRDLMKGDAERRQWFLLAVARARELESKKDPKDSAERASLVGNRLQQALPLLKDPVEARRRDGRNILRDIRDLYAGETGDIAKLVTQAKKVLSESAGS